MYFFLHMHKCAGSTVVRKAKLSKLKLAENHRNGNMVRPSGRTVRFTELSEGSVQRLLTDVHESGVQFIASEFDFPKIEYLACGVPIDLFTVLRDPLSRASSHYRFAKLYGSVHKDVNFKEFMNFSFTKKGPLSRTSNYYTRKLCSMSALEPLGPEQLERAMQVLESFRSVILLERDNLDAELSKIGIDALVKPVNRTAALVSSTLSETDLTLSNDDQEWFKETNSLDYEMLMRVWKSKDQQELINTGAA